MSELKDRIILILCLIIFMMYLFFAMVAYRIRMVDESLLPAISTNQAMCYDIYNKIHSLGQMEE